MQQPQQRYPTQPPHLPIMHVPVRETCPWCDGKGRIGAASPYCAQCFEQWTPAQIATHLDRRWHFSWNPFKLFATRLPCGHALKWLNYSDPTCKRCKGTGGRWRYLSLAALNRMAGWFDRTRPPHYGTEIGEPFTHD